jgi:Transposase
MLHVGLDLSRRRLDVCLVDDAGEVVAQIAAAPDADGLRHLAMRVQGGRVRAVIESMNGARFVHDTLGELGWEVLIADAQKVKGLAPLACKTDKIDAHVLAVLSQRDLVPAIWLPDPTIRREREPRGSAGSTPTPSPRRSVTSNGSLRRPSWSATPACARASCSPATPTGAARSPSAGRGICAWGLFEAAMNACKHPLYAERYQHTKRRLGRQRGPKVAQIELSRGLTEAIWHMLTRNQPFAPAGAGCRLAS